MTAFCSRRFEARIEILRNYIFSDSLINENYHRILNDIENIAIALEKCMACNIQFLRSWKWSGGKDKHCAKFLTPLSQKPCRPILLSCLVSFLRPFRLRDSKKLSLLLLHLFNSINNEKKSKNTDTIFEPHYTLSF